MCGISGYCGLQAEPGLGAAMNAALAHRGPDAAGWWQAPRGDVALGNRRLQIVDLSPAAAMPMSNEDGSVWITFNGEIYNAAALREQLQPRHRFRSRSDTEAILHAYEEWGTDCLERLRGMFAFALWDDRRQRLLLARDRLGKKPLYYWRQNRGLLFASEIRALLCSPLVSREPDLEALADFVRYRYVLGERTGFRDLRRLLPGHAALWQQGEWRSWRYWQLPAAEEIERPPGEWLSRIAELLEEAVGLRMISDVPVGVMLSGGLDSSLLAALAAKRHPALRAFTAEFPGAGALDESGQARQIANALGLAHFSVRIAPPGPEDLLQLAAILEEPLADAAAWPTLQVARLARAQGVPVLLSGEGADEVFWGYPRYRALQLGDRLRWLRWGAGEAAGLDRSRWRRYWQRGSLEERNYRALLGLPAALQSQLYPGLDRAPRAPLPDRRGAASRAARWDLEHWLPNDLLLKLDKTTMSAGVEGRCPYLDAFLVEAGQRLPVRFKQSLFAGKIVLRRLAAGALPPAAASVRKRAFRPPLLQWLDANSALGAWLPGLLAESELARQGVVSRAAETLLRRRESAGALSARQHLWTLMCLLAWERAVSRAAAPFHS